MNDSEAAIEKPKRLYEQVKHYLLDRIESGQLPDGSRIPSEYALMETLGASRMTVHRALREMSAAGLLRRVQGVGTFVSKPVSRSALLEIFDISEDILRRGHVHQSRILALEARRADIALAEAFSLRRGAKIFYSEVVHTEDGIPVQLEERFVSPHFAPRYLDQDFTLQTTNRYLQSIAAASEVEHVVHAITADVRMQNLLEISPAEPCLLVERRTWTQTGPATSSRLIHPGSRYSLGSRYNPSQAEHRQNPVW
jgi:GntR family transcriptional regulator, histidine utilization repressor